MFAAPSFPLLSSPFLSEEAAFLRLLVRTTSKLFDCTVRVLPCWLRVGRACQVQFSFHTHMCVSCLRLLCVPPLTYPYFVYQFLPTLLLASLLVYSGGHLSCIPLLFHSLILSACKETMGRGGRGAVGPKQPSEDFVPGTAFSVNCGKCQQVNNMSYRMCEEFAFTCGHCGAENAANTRAIMASYCSGKFVNPGEPHDLMFDRSGGLGIDVRPWKYGGHKPVQGAPTVQIRVTRQAMICGCIPWFCG